MVPQSQRLILAKQGCVDPARRDGADADVVGRKLQCGALCHHVDGGLAHVVGKGQLRCKAAVDRRGIDDHAGLSHLDKLPAGREDAVVHATLVDCGDGVPVSAGFVFKERFGAADAGVVDHDIQGAETFACGIHHGADLAGVGRVHHAGCHVAVEFLAQRLEGVGVQVCREDACAVGQKFLCGRLADAATGAGDCHDFAVQCHYFSLLAGCCSGIGDPLSL